MMDKVEKAVIDLNGEWPTWAIQKEKGGYYEVTGGVLGKDMGVAPTMYVCTRPEFMEARKRLENKPSWDSAPKWAKALGQDSDGKWVFLPHYDLKDHDHEEWLINNTDSGDYDSRPKGHVFGDWRQSLEPRPSSHPMNNEQQDHKEGEGVEWVNGVPPVGTWVEEVMGGEHVEVVCHGVGNKFCGRDKEGYIGIFDYTTDVIPIQSHRDKVIEAAQRATGVKQKFCGALYDAGMLKLPGEEE